MSEPEEWPAELTTLHEKHDLFYMLEFEELMFKTIYKSDVLLVAAKGINFDVVVLNFLRVHCDPGNLVIILNSNEAEEKFFVDKLNDPNVHVTTATSGSTDSREDLYLSGGIHFVTTRILVVDMLKKRVPIEHITGFIILRAHSVIESCQVAFVLRLFRQHNKIGFVKAFSNSAQSFTAGYGHIERVMRALFIKKYHVWPRFHTAVQSSLREHEPQVIELQIPISDNMRKIQTCILDLMNLTVKELQRINRTVEIAEITVENCLTKQFNKILQSQLDIIWNQLSSHSKQLVADLRTLRHLITTLFYTDPVTFYSTLQEYRSMEYAQNAMWVVQEPAEMLFTQASSIVFSGERELNPEFCPKWKTLLEILKVEIPHEIKQSDGKDVKILVLCSDNKTCYQLNELLTQGPYHYLFVRALRKGVTFKSLNKTFENCGKLPEEVVSPKKPRLDKEEESSPEEAEKANDDFSKRSYLLTMSQLVLDVGSQKTSSSDGDIESADSSGYVFEPFAEMENMNMTQICDSISQPTVLIQTFKGLDGYVNLEQSLVDLKPSYIIMYHCDITAVREIEMYEAHRKRNTHLKVYFLLHSETIEEQSYLTALKREKDAFQFLIKLKAQIVVPEDQDGKSDFCASLQRDLKSPTKSTRQGGKVEQPTTRKFVIVDMREFRSELPALIHKRGIDIEPIIISVGDYILTPEICVERKSLADLVSSLKSGRLYQQCKQMQRYYAKPMLLIEFDQNKQFCWQNTYMVSLDGNNFNIQQKLLLLTLHFPKLRIIWSQNPYASAQLFEELKDGRGEPNIEYASSIGGSVDLNVVEAKYNSGIYDMVQRLPGITSKNIDNFLKKFNNMDNVVTKTEEELKEILGNAVDARALYSAIHEDHNPSETDQPKPKSKFFKPKFTKKK